MKTIGYLGLGVMGYGMTSNLIDKSGTTIYGYDPVPALRERGLEPAAVDGLLTANPRAFFEGTSSR